MMIDGAHIRAVPGHQSRHLDVTVGKIEVSGRKPRRFAFAPKGADSPVDILRAALGAQGWRPGQRVTVISDGEAMLPNLVRAATGESVRHILDWFHLSMRMRPIEQMLLGLSGRDLRDIRPLMAAGLDRACQASAVAWPAGASGSGAGRFRLSLGKYRSQRRRS